MGNINRVLYSIIYVLKQVKSGDFTENEWRCDEEYLMQLQD
jgi:hypothetical protein